MKPRLVVLIGLLLVLLVVAGCAGGDDASEVETVTAPTEVADEAETAPAEEPAAEPAPAEEPAAEPTPAQPPASPPPVEAPTGPPAPPPASESAEVVERVLPSVVNVRVQGFGGGGGQGSGVVYRADGIILTNNHVVAGSSGVTVVFNDGIHEEPLEGTVIGTAPERDLAVVRVDADDLIPIQLGSSLDLRLGEDVWAMGFPLGLGGPTVTRGIVSGLERTIEPAGGVRLEGVLQTDAAINPGNSGGALVDAGGRLVGINTAGASAAFAENIGFAIAIDEAIPVIEEILEKPPEERAWLGVSIAEVDSDLAAAQLGLPPGTRGVLIVGIVPGGPADEARLRDGDIIVGLGDEVIASAEDLTSSLAARNPGDQVEVEILVSDGTRTVTLELGQRPVTLG